METQQWQHCVSACAFECSFKRHLKFLFYIAAQICQTTIRSDGQEIRMCSNKDVVSSWRLSRPGRERKRPATGPGECHSRLCKTNNLLHAMGKGPQAAKTPRGKLDKQFCDKNIEITLPARKSLQARNPPGAHEDPRKKRGKRMYEDTTPSCDHDAP